MTAVVHTFERSGLAYDATQCDESIKNGDTLLVPTEGVVGLAWTWPVAVTAQPGALHTVSTEGSVQHLMPEAGWSTEQIRAACRIATDLQLPLHPKFAEYLQTEASN